MCGITAFIGYYVYETIYDSLIRLKNRGYDSAGILTFIDGHWNLNKYASSTAFDQLKPTSSNERFGVGIGHTRWATHGGKTQLNAHPHEDQEKKFGLVHNGIIENYESIKKFLSSHHYTFTSETDSEVIVQLLSYYSHHCATIEDAIQKVVSELEGTYALCIISKSNPDTLYCIRKGSPMLIGWNEDKSSFMVTSEVSGFGPNITEYMVLQNHDLCTINKKLKYSGTYTSYKLNHAFHQWTPDPYPFWTLKEIMEQQLISQKVLCNGSRANGTNVKLGGLDQIYDKLIHITTLVMIGCGTSYFAAKSCVPLFKSVLPCYALDAGEACEDDFPLSNFGVICISQSGETKDVYDKIPMLKSKGAVLIGVINVVDSYIAREMDGGVYLHIGKEVGVASTKAFTAQVMVLHLIANWFYQNKNIKFSFVEPLLNLEKQIQYTIERNHELIKSLATTIQSSRDLFVLAKGKYLPYAEEGALKIKEISYIHAEAYGSSSLKHGPYALIEEGTPVILFSPKDEYFSKHQSVKEEVVGRGGLVIGISDVALDHKYTFSFIVPKSNFYGILSNVVLQLLAYELSIAKGINPDMPRNLAKVVTTD
jgi:glucosamine--fructose-6-phosphate aminotransferase (isomerizing)